MSKDRVGWRRIGTQEVALLPRKGWPGVWDSLVSAITGSPIKTVPTGITVAVWVKSKDEVDVSLHGLQVEVENKRLRDLLAKAEARVKELEGDNSVLRLQISAKRSTWGEET